MQESVKVKGRVGLSLSSIKQRKIRAGKKRTIGILTADLHKHMREYLHYRYTRRIGLKMKAPYTLAQLDSEEATINRLRKELKQQPRKLMRDLRKTLKFI